MQAPDPPPAMGGPEHTILTSLKKMARDGVPMATLRRLATPLEPNLLTEALPELDRLCAEAEAAVAHIHYTQAVSGESVPATLAWVKARLYEATETPHAPADNTHALASLRELLDSVAAHRAASADSPSAVVAASPPRPTGADRS